MVNLTQTIHQVERNWSVKVKVKLSLCLTKYHTVKTDGGMEVYLHVLLTSELDGGEWLASGPGRFNPGRKHPVPIG
jgi:hypothetical protein